MTTTSDQPPDRQPSLSLGSLGFWPLVRFSPDHPTLADTGSDDLDACLTDMDFRLLLGAVRYLCGQIGQGTANGIGLERVRKKLERASGQLVRATQEVSDGQMP